MFTELFKSQTLKKTLLFKVDEEYIERLARRVARLDTFIEQNPEVISYELQMSLDQYSSFKSISEEQKEKLRSCLNKLYQVFHNMFAVHEMTRFLYCDLSSDFHSTVRIEFYQKLTRRRDQKKVLCEHQFLAETEVFGFLQWYFIFLNLSEMYSILRILQKFFLIDNGVSPQSLSLKCILQMGREKIISIMRSVSNTTKFSEAYQKYKDRDRNRNEIIT